MARVAIICAIGKRVVSSCQNFCTATKAAKSAPMNRPVSTTIFAIGAAMATNAATSATPITALSATRIGTRLSCTISMSGSSDCMIAAPWPTKSSSPGISATTWSNSSANGSSAAITALTTPRIRSLSGSSASENLSKISAGTSPSEAMVLASVAAMVPSCSTLSPAIVMAVRAEAPRSSNCVPKSCTPMMFCRTLSSIAPSGPMTCLNMSAIVTAPLSMPARMALI